MNHARKCPAEKAGLLKRRSKARQSYTPSIKVYGHRTATVLMRVFGSILTCRPRQTSKDAPLRGIIKEVIKQHQALGIPPDIGWIRELGRDYSESTVHRVYRQSGHAAQWRKRSRKIRRSVRINPSAMQPYEVSCMDFAEGPLSTVGKKMALLIKDEATSFRLSINVLWSFKGVEV